MMMHTRKLLTWCVLLLCAAKLQSQVIAIAPPSTVSLSHNAIQLYEQKLCAEARMELSRCLRRDDKFAGADIALLREAEADAQRLQRTFALRKLGEFINQRPNSPYYPLALYQSALIRFEQKEYNPASTVFHDACESFDNNIVERHDTSYSIIKCTSQFFEAVCLSHLGEHDKAQPLYDSVAAVRRSEYADDATFARASYFEMTAEYGTALTKYLQLSESFPASNVVLASSIRQAQCYLMLREPSNAVTRRESAQNIRNDSSATGRTLFAAQTLVENCQSEIRYLKAESFNQLQQYENARNEFHSLSNDSSAPLLLRYQSMLGEAWSLLNLDQPASAAAIYKTVIDSLPDNSSHLHSLARLYHAVALKRSSDRERATREFLQMSGTAGYFYVAQALTELGQIYYEDGIYDKARRALERAEHESSDPLCSVRALLLLGATYSELQSWRSAIRAYQSAEIIARKSKTEQMPQRLQFIAESRLKRGIAFAQNGQSREAIGDLNGFVGEYQTDPRMDEALFWLGEAYFKLELVQNAEESYQKIISAYSASTRREEALYALGWLYFRTQSFEKSNAEFANLLREYPTTRFATDVNLRRGDGSYLLKKYKEAIASYRDAIKRGANTEQAQYASFQIAQSLYRNKDYTAAINGLKNFVKQYPSSKLCDHAEYTIAWIYTLQEKNVEAIAQFDHLIQSYPQSELVPNALYYKANALYNKGDFENAITEYRTLIGLYPSNYYSGAAFQALQDALVVLGREDEAIAAGQEFQSKTTNSNMREQIALKTIEIFIKKGDFGSAAKEYQDFLNKYPESSNSAEALYWLAKSQTGMGDDSSASLSYELLCAKHPSTDYAQMALSEQALLKLRHSEIFKADSLFDLISQRYPGTDAAARADYERAQMTIQLGDTTRAVQYFRKSAATARGEFSAQSWYRLGMYFRAKAQYDSARACFDKIISYEENLLLAAEAAYRCGESHMAEKKWEDATAAFIVVKTRFDGQEDWYTLSLINLGECYELLKDGAKARETYQTVVILHPNDDYGKTAQSRLKRIGRY